MKHIANKVLFFVFASALVLSSCIDQKQDDILNSKDFEYKTTRDLSISITALNSSKLAVQGAMIELYTQNPLTENGVLSENSSKHLAFKGITNTLGELNCKISLATTVDSLVVLVNYIGLPNFQIVKIDGSEMNLIIGASSWNMPQTNAASRAPGQDIRWITNFNQVSGLYYYNNWNKTGVPLNLSKPNDIVSSEFLADVNASLPERIKLSESHPEYLSTEDDGSIELVKDAEVWVTFVHEGAGFTNTLAYYSYPSSQKPQTVNDISHSTLMFPNASFLGSGGGLVSGDKVQLLYYDAAKNQYGNVFPAGTSVAWQLRSNGWDAGKQTVGTGYHNYYSDKRFNPETDIAKRKHNVILKDNSRQLLLIGFEDLRLDQGSDEDFNDAVFYATVSPYSAIKNGIYQTIDSPNDKDDDGVSDANDDYPDDPTKAFNNYYPSQFEVATLAFEDLWPSRGDYDFNDLVVDYNFNQITNAQNRVVEIEGEITVRAIGASFLNGFGIEFNTSPQNVKAITGLDYDGSIVKRAANGTELNQQNAVVVLFENAYKVTSRPGSNATVNTINGSTYQRPGKLKFSISFNNPVAFSTLGTPPYNPFIFINGDRTKEVHLPGSKPTSLADLRLFDTGDDNSSVASGKFYVSNKYLPWAINLPVRFDYPAEKEDIRLSYLLFNQWVESSGFRNMDWYLNKNGYRNNQLIFKAE